MTARSSLIVLFSLTVVPAAAQKTRTGPASAARPAAAAKAKPRPNAPAAPIPYEPPASAERQPDGGYRWVDPSGAVWIYRQSPFGWGRMKESDLPARSGGAAAAAVELPQVTAAEAATIHFRQEGPFGMKTWTRSRAELNGLETEALRKFEAAPPAGPVPGSPPPEAKPSGKEKK